MCSPMRAVWRGSRTTSTRTTTSGISRDGIYLYIYIYLFIYIYIYIHIPGWWFVKVKSAIHLFSTKLVLYHIISISTMPPSNTWTLRLIHMAIMYCHVLSMFWYERYVFFFILACTHVSRFSRNKIPGHSDLGGNRKGRLSLTAVTMWCHVKYTECKSKFAHVLSVSSHR